MIKKCFTSKQSILTWIKTEATRSRPIQLYIKSSESKVLKWAIVVLVLEINSRRPVAFCATIKATTTKSRDTINAELGNVKSRLAKLQEARAARLAATGANYSSNVSIERLNNNGLLITHYLKWSCSQHAIYSKGSMRFCLQTENLSGCAALLLLLFNCWAFFHDIIVAVSTKQQ